MPSIPCLQNSTKDSIKANKSIFNSFHTSTVVHQHEIIKCQTCNENIQDLYYLDIAKKFYWHLTCLKCTVCECNLKTKCFIKNGKFYCKNDYVKMFQCPASIVPQHTDLTCKTCYKGINSNDYVIRIDDYYLFHIDCFVCVLCLKQIRPGQKYGILNNKLYCDAHYLNQIYEDNGTTAVSSTHLPVVSSSSSSSSSSSLSSIDHQNQLSHYDSSSNESTALNDFKVTYKLEITSPLNDFQDNFPKIDYNSSLFDVKRERRSCESNDQLEDTPTDATILNDLDQQNPFNLQQQTQYLSLHQQQQHQHQLQQKKKRNRTSFKHQQLRTMKAYFLINQNPDSKDLKELSDRTGLTKRTLQVWFQNSRAKQRKTSCTLLRDNLMQPQQQQQQQSVGQRFLPHHTTKQMNESNEDVEDDDNDDDEDDDDDENNHDYEDIDEFDVYEKKFNFKTTNDYFYS